MTGKSIHFTMCVGLAFWPWLFIVFPLTMVFEPFRRIVEHSPGFLSNLALVLLGIAECIWSYLICVVVIYIITLYILRKFINKEKGKDDEVLTLEDVL